MLGGERTSREPTGAAGKRTVLRFSYVFYVFRAYVLYISFKILSKTLN